MKILVCITHVPDTTAKIAFQSDGKTFDDSGVQFIIGPYDEYALAKAVELKTELAAELTVLNVGLASSDASLRKALAIGADQAVRIDAEARDASFVARQIADYAKSENFDLIMMGRETIDFAGAVVHSMLSELLGVPSISPVVSLALKADGSVSLKKEMETGVAEIESKLPLILGCQEPIAEWKIAGMRGIMAARTKSIKVIPAVKWDKSSDFLKAEKVSMGAKVKIVSEDDMDDLVDFILSV